MPNLNDPYTLKDMSSIEKCPRVHANAQLRKGKMPIIISILTFLQDK